ncbi:sulfatase-like hydrolase/transferase [Longitalea arenae]|uniref:sulfatase-like hydrolase/transferase n=1 Tax=Longitalea arenae TaxID=2812558 RepID=UPI00196880B3|nr:sulfatase-like hydrolase/transferase [Longitalea arenae]
MKLSSIKKFPFHTFFLPAFFILHINNEYFSLLPAPTIVEFFLYYVLLAAVLLVTGRLLYRSITKAGVWATTLLIPFFFFGAAHDLVKTTPFIRSFSSYTIVLPVLLISLLLFSWYCKKKAGNFDKAHKYFTILFTILVSMELVILAQKTITNNQENNLASHNEFIKPVANCHPCEKPDIFFIVFDEYASSRSLQHYFGFDNSLLDSSFKKNNYYIATNSKSNYNITPLSIGSTFNLQYFNRPLENETVNTLTLLQSCQSFKESRLPDLLGQSGYAIHNFGFNHFTNYPVSTFRYFENFERNALYHETLFGRITRDILWNIWRLSPALRKKRAQLDRQEQMQFIERNKKNWQLVLQELKTQNEQPKFVFSHVMMPHAPFYLDRKGNRTNDFSSIYNKNNNPGPYLEQLMYTNTWIDSILNATDRNFSRPRVVIVEGDHGYRDTPFVPGQREKHFMNLNTYYFSDKDYSMLYDSISPVNTFRVVMNKYFHTKLPLLKDSTILLQ